MSRSYHSWFPLNGPHGLPHDPLKSCVAPRPIGWISTLGPSGTLNLAPYSYFNLVNDAPPMCMFASSGHKDTLANAERSGEFVYNMVSEKLTNAMNLSATTLDEEVDEFAAAGLTPEASVEVSPPRVAEAPVQFECRVHDIIDLPATTQRRNALVLANIVAVHINRDVMVNGLIDLSKINPVSRLGYMQYSELGQMFNLKRPASLDDTQTRKPV